MQSWDPGGRDGALLLGLQVRGGEGGGKEQIGGRSGKAEWGWDCGWNRGWAWGEGAEWCGAMGGPTGRTGEWGAGPQAKGVGMGPPLALAQVPTKP